MRRRNHGKSKSFPAGLATGLVGSIAVLIVSMVVFTNLLMKEAITSESLGYAIVACLAGSSFTGAAIAIKNIQRRKLMTAMTFAVLLLGTLLCIAMLLFEQDTEGICATAITIFGGSAAAAMMTSTKKRK